MSDVTNSDGCFYDKYWEQDFGPPYLDSLLPAFEQLGILPETKVLDVGCGNGALGGFLIRTYGCQVYGTDVSPVALKAAAARGYIVELAEPDPSGPLRRPFHGVQFDVVILSAVLEHVFDPEALLVQAYATLKDGGYVVVLTPNVTWFLNRILFALGIWEHPLLGGTPGHIRYLNKQMLEDLLTKAGFQRLNWSFSPIAVLPAGQDLFVRNRRVPFLRRLVGKRARRRPSLLAENLVVLGRKPISTTDAKRWAELKPRDRVDGLKVLHIAATASGANWMFDILRALRTRGYDVAALISGTEGDLAGKLEREGIPYYVGDLDVFSAADVIGIIRKIFKLAGFLREHRFDIVHYHLFTSVILGRAAAWIADVPLRFSMITGPFYLEAPAPREIDYRTLWMDTKVIASCEYTRQLYFREGIPPKKLERIFYGADESRFDPATAEAQKLRRELGIGAEEPIIGMIAYFYAPLPRGPWTPPHLQDRAVKGHEILLQAAQIVLKRNPSVKFLLVGKGWDTVGEQYEKDLKELVKRMHLDKAVIFTGPRSDIPDILASFDVSVQCSLSENLGGTIESLLMARPTIATAVGGMVDSVRHEQTGLLVPPYDPQRLAEAILKLLDDPEEARRLGQNGRQLMLREFCLGKTVDEIDRLYQSSARRILKYKRDNPSLSAHYYRMYGSLFHFLVLAFRWIAFFLRRDVPRGISASIVRIAEAGQGMWADSKNVPKRLAVVLADLAPLLLPFAALTFLLPPPWNMIAISTGIVAFVLFRFLFAGPTMTLVRLLTKRLFDTLVAAFLLVVTLPVWLIIALAIRLDSPGPVFSHQGRIGRFGRPFETMRFRTVTLEAGESGLAVPLRKDDPRITRVGRVLRQFNLDELPQLINVLRGEMSLVGPRPALPMEADQCTGRQQRRLEVRPGITGWDRIRGRDCLSWAERTELDIWYADHGSFWLDLYILFRSLLMVVRHKGGHKDGR